MTPLDPEDVRWIAWRNEPRGKEGKPTKVPYGRGGRPAKADDEATWLVRAEAENLARRIVNGVGGGVGYELGDVGNDLFIAGIDLDSCLKDGVLAPWAAAILDLAATYAEVSPSGHGVKAFFYLGAEDVRWFLDLVGVPAGGWGCRRGIPGEDARDHGPAIEVYCKARYFAVTENRWPSAPDRLRVLGRADLERLARLIPPAKTASSGKSAGGDNSRSAAAFRKGAAMRRAGKTFEEFVEALRADPETAAWCREKGEANGGRELRRIWDKVEAEAAGVTLADFHAYMPEHSYIFTPTRALWPAASVNARFPPIKVGADDEIKASTWLDRNRHVEQMTWAPGLPEIIEDRLLYEGGWLDHHGVRCFNQYRTPTIIPGDARRADRWLDHVHLVYPDDAGHLLCWLAHRIQRPHEKINHALVLGGEQGIGKDTLLEPVKCAIGPWNFQEASPQQVLGRFNGFLKAVILRISEARDLGEFDRFKLYDHMKSYTASPPDTLRVDEKHLREYPILNVCGVVITTNHRTDGIYLPAEDRRHFVAWSDRTKEDDCFADDYWRRIYAYFEDGGAEAVAAYLGQLDISTFDPKAPPPKTPAFWAIVDANRSPEEPEIADVLDLMDRPKAFTLATLIHRAETQPGGTEGDFIDWLKERKNRRVIPHRLEKCGYVPVRNPDAESDGQWSIAGRRQTVYAQKNLSLLDQIAAAQGLQPRF